MADMGGWFGPELEQGAADFYAVYESHYDSVQALTLEAAAGHPEFGPILRSMTAEMLAAQDRDSRERLRRAFVDGDWEPYETDLRVQGATYAKMGISFTGWYDLIRLYAKAIVPRLVETYSSAPARLTGAFLALQSFLDRAMAGIGEAYLATKEAIVRARERDLQVTLDSIGDAVIATDAEGRVSKMNPVAERLTGWTIEEARGRSLREVFRIESEDDGTPAESPVERVLREGVVVGLANHTALVTRDERRVPIADSGAPIRAEGGEIEGVVLVFRDVTDDRKYEQQLLVFENLFKHAGWGIAMVVPGHRCPTQVNPAFAAMHGYTVEEIQRTPSEELLAPEIRGRIDELRQNIATKGRHTWEQMHVRKDGTRFPVMIESAMINDEHGKALYRVSNIIDITERKKASAALEASEARKTAILRSALDGIVWMDRDGRITDFNPAAERKFGLQRSEAVGKILSDLIIPERYRAAHKLGVERYLATGETRVIGRRLELTALHADGSEFPAEISVVAIENDEAPAFVGFIRDLTDQKASERMRMRSVELEAENRRVLEASRLKSEFLANMSHELRTPLNSIIGFAELLHDGEVGPVAPQQREFLGDILTSGRHLLQLINDVLDLSKVEAGRMEFHPEPLDLVAVVHEVTAALRAMAAQKGLEIHPTVDEAARHVVADAARLKQILYNFVSNAIKFTPAGGRVQVRAIAQDEHGFRLEVEDNGIGIAEGDLRRLFVEFQQLDAGRAKRHQGTGLGLALTRRLGEAMGGTVGVESKPGTRTVFHVELPRRAATTSALPLRRRLSSVAPGVPVVLVVEDNPADQEEIVGILQTNGYAVETASTVAQALALCRQRAYDAITLDLLLPDGSGLDVLRALRSSGPNRHVPVVVITLVVDRAVAGYVVEDVLPKPLEPGALLEALRRAGASPGNSDVMVVDDDAGSLKLMNATLAQLGYRAACFRDGESALAALSRLRPQAVVLDLVMPGMDGFRFLELFRALPDHVATPVLVWTVKDLSAEDRELLASTQGVLPKGGARGAALVQALREHLAKRGAVAAAKAKD
jgi:two-component system, sensor histidine kinase and response regulator